MCLMRNEFRTNGRRAESPHQLARCATRARAFSFPFDGGIPIVEGEHGEKYNICFCENTSS